MKTLIYLAIGAGLIALLGACNNSDGSASRGQSAATQTDRAEKAHPIPIAELKKTLEVKQLLLEDLGSKYEQAEANFQEAVSDFGRVQSDGSRYAIKEAAARIVSLEKRKVDLLQQGTNLLDTIIMQKKQLLSQRALENADSDIVDREKKLVALRAALNDASAQYAKLSSAYSDVVAADEVPREPQPSDGDITEALLTIGRVEGKSISRDDIERNMPLIREAIGIPKGEK